jgi:uncharacterized DUF497 family protein
MLFEWDDTKAATNLRDHGVSFVFATRAFEDQLGVENIDDREDYGEERTILIGYAIDGGSEKLLTIVYTERGEVRRLISARPATSDEQDEYYRENAI